MGMIVGQAVHNDRGQVLIGAGEPIEEKHIRALKIWGISAVNVGEGGDPHQSTDPKETSVSTDRQQIRNCAARMFRLDSKNPIHPAMKQVIVSCILQMERHGVPQTKRFTLPKDPNGNGDAPSTKIQMDPSKLTVSRLISRIKDIVSLPDIYQKLMEVIDDPLSAAADVAEVISCDAGLSARLLRIVNSSFYSFPSKIDTISRGVTILGTKELCDLALATSVMNLFDDSLNCLVDMNQFWNHSIGCGVFARKLALFRHEPNAERFFVMGILHDIGRLILLSYVPEIIRGVIVRAARTRNPLNVIEKQTLGFTHADVGAALLKAWKLPDSHQEAVGLHHHPSRARRFKQETATIHVADIMATAMSMGSSGNVLVPNLIPEVWDRLEMSPSVLTRLAEEAESEVNHLVQIFR